MIILRNFCQIKDEFSFSLRTLQRYILTYLIKDVVKRHKKRKSFLKLTTMEFTHTHKSKYLSLLSLSHTNTHTIPSPHTLFFHLFLPFLHIDIHLLHSLALSLSLSHTHTHTLTRSHKHTHIHTHS